MESLAGELLPCDNTHFGVALFISATRISDLSPDSPENKAWIQCPSFYWKAWIHDLESESQRKRGRKWWGNSGGAVSSSRLLLSSEPQRDTENHWAAAALVLERSMFGESMRQCVGGKEGWRRRNLSAMSLPISCFLLAKVHHPESSLPASYEPWAHLWMAIQKARSYTL